MTTISTDDPCVSHQTNQQRSILPAYALSASIWVSGFATNKPRKWPSEFHPHSCMRQSQQPQWERDRFSAQWTVVSKR